MPNDAPPWQPPSMRYSGSVSGSNCRLEGCISWRTSTRNSNGTSTSCKEPACSGLAVAALSNWRVERDCGQGLLLSFTNIPTEQARREVRRLERRQHQARLASTVEPVARVAQSGQNVPVIIQLAHRSPRSTRGPPG